MSINLISSFLVYFLLINPSFFLGRWKLEKHGPINSLLQSETFAAIDLDDQISIQNAANLYLENHYLEFRMDTVFWSDVESGDIGVVKKIGKWYLNGDTLIIMDYEKISMIKYLIAQDGKDGFTQRDILPRGQIAKSPVIFSRIKE